MSGGNLNVISAKTTDLFQTTLCLLHTAHFSGHEMATVREFFYLGRRSDRCQTGLLLHFSFLNFTSLSSLEMHFIFRFYL